MTVFLSHSLHFNYANFKLSGLLAVVQFRLFLHLWTKCLFLPSNQIHIFFQTNRQKIIFSTFASRSIPDFSPPVLLNLCQVRDKAIFTSRVETRYVLQSNLCKSLCNFQAGMAEDSWACLKVNKISVLATANFLYHKNSSIYIMYFTTWLSLCFSLRLNKNS